MKTIFENLLSLTSAEIISKLIGLLTISYLARVLTPEEFGILGFATAFVSYFLLLVIFGFDTYGAREIAKNKESIENLVNSIFSLRLIFAVIWYLVLIFTVLFLLDRSFQVKIILLITGFTLFTNALSLNWVFQGIEKMKYIALRQVLTSLMSLLGVIVFVKSSNDVFIASLITTFSGLLNSISLIIVYKRVFPGISLRLRFIDWKKILTESLPLAVSLIMISIYYNLDMVMMGYLKSEAETGIYNAAYKIFLMGVIPLQLIMNSFFPSFSRVGLTKSKEFGLLINRYAWLMFSAGIISTFILFFFSKYFVLLLFGQKFLSAVIPLSILALNAMVISSNMFFGNPLIAWGKQKHYLAAISMGAISNIILNFALIPKYSYIGASLATLLSEIAVFAGVFVVFQKYTYRKI